MRTTIALAVIFGGISSPVSGESLLPPSYSVVIENVDQKVDKVTLHPSGDVDVELFSGQLIRCPRLGMERKIALLGMAQSLSTAAVQVTIPEMKCSADDLEQPPPRLQIGDSRSLSGLRDIFFAPKCGFEFAAKTEADARAVRELLAVLSEEAGRCARDEKGPEQFAKQRLAALVHRKAGMGALAESRLDDAQREFEACLKAAPDLRLRMACRRGLADSVRIENAVPSVLQREQIEYFITFASNTAEVTDEGRAILSRIFDTTKYFPFDTVHLEILIPEIASPEASVAKQRIEVVRKTLEKSGVHRGRIGGGIEIGEQPPNSVRVVIVGAN